MTTTVMRDSVVGDAWIREMCAANPVQLVLNDKGEPNGNLLSGPVRLTFCDALFTAKPQMRSQPNSPIKFWTGILFTPFSVLDVLWAEYYRIAASDFADCYNNGQYYGIDNPVYDQGSKMKFQGYTPGCMALNATSNYKPPVVDIRNNPITDESKVYPGVWAIVALNAYPSGKNTPRKGPRFGLQTVMIVGDDKPLAGGAPDPRAQFKGVNVKPPTAVPAAAFGQGVQTPGQRPGVGAFYPPPPPGGAAAAFAPPGAPPPPMAPPPLGTGDEDLSQFS